MTFEELYKGKPVIYKGRKFRVTQYQKNDDGSVRVEIIEGDWNPFFVWMSQLK